MGKITPAILVFIVSGLVYITSSLFEYNNIVFIAKPVFISSAIFHYWVEAKGQIDFINLMLLLLYFLSGSLNLFQDNDGFKYVLLLNILVYLMLLISVFKKKIVLKEVKLQKKTLRLIFVFMSFIIGLAYFLLFFVFTKKFLLFNYLVVYAFILSCLVIVSTALFLFKKTLSHYYLLLTSYSYLSCDLFYALYNYSFDSVFFKFLSMLGSVLSYYFIINYFLLTSLDNKDIDTINA